jgi:predicted flap endonuclease-1-like 5' DNA nuclease
MPLVQCTYGPASTEIMGYVYEFRPDEYGRCVAEVWDPKHINMLTAVVHYRVVAKEPEPIVLTSLEPATAEVGGPDFTMMAVGTGFMTDCSIVFNGGAEVTEYISPTLLSTIVRPSTASGPVSVPVLIRDRVGEESGALDFTFTEPVAAPPPEPEGNVEQTELPPDEDPGDQPVTAISGIGAATAAKLESVGITTVRQLAELTDEQAADIDAQLALNGRIARDGWVESAKALIA